MGRNPLGISLLGLLAGCGSASDEPAPKATATSADQPAPGPVLSDAAVDPADARPEGFAARFAEPPLPPDKARALIASLDGVWVNDAGLERKTWIIRGGQVTERVTRRGSKSDRGRTRRFRIEARRPGRLEVIGDRPQSYYFLKRGKAFYTSPVFGIYKMKSRRRFDVLDTAGNLIEYRNGDCTVRAPGGPSKPVRCMYSVSYYHKVLTVRYRLPSSGEHTVAVFHGEAGHLLHEQLLWCCKFSRR